MNRTGHWLYREHVAQPAPHLHAISVTCDDPACARKHWLARRISEHDEPTIMTVLCHGCEDLLIVRYDPV